MRNKHTDFIQHPSAEQKWQSGRYNKWYIRSVAFTVSPDAWYTKELNRMKIWFDEDKNLSKTTFIFFGNRPTNTKNKLMMNGIELERVSDI